MGEIAVFSGSAHRILAQGICDRLGVPLLPSRLRRFANDCLEVQLDANCRERDVFLIQPLVPPVQENLVELLLMLDAARGASAARRTVVMPHFAYARSDKKDAPRISLGGRLVADLLSTAGASRVLTMTLHSPQVHGFFSVPVDHLHALNELAGHFRRTIDPSRAVVVSPDLGNAKEAAAFAKLVGASVALASKKRFSDGDVLVSALIGDVHGRHAIVLDDEIAKGSTMVETVGHLRREGVASIRLACTHGVFAPGAVERLAALEGVEEIVCTDTVPIRDEDRHPKLRVITVAPALAEAIKRIHNGDSVSELFRAR